MDQSLALAYTADASLDVIITDNRKKWDASDHNDEVPPEETAGHSIWVAGDAQQPWVCCSKCGAYTNKSVRNLANT